MGFTKSFQSISRCWSGEEGGRLQISSVSTSGGLRPSLWSKSICSHGGSSYGLLLRKRQDEVNAAIQCAAPRGIIGCNRRGFAFADRNYVCLMNAHFLSKQLSD